jgi:hypothetical protein
MMDTEPIYHTRESVTRYVRHLLDIRREQYEREQYARREQNVREHIRRELYVREQKRRRIALEPQRQILCDQEIIGLREGMDEADITDAQLEEKDRFSKIIKKNRNDHTVNIVELIMTRCYPVWHTREEVVEFILYQFLDCYDEDNDYGEVLDEVFYAPIMLENIQRKFPNIKNNLYVEKVVNKYARRFLMQRCLYIAHEIAPDITRDTFYEELYEPIKDGRIKHENDVYDFIHIIIEE